MCRLAILNVGLEDMLPYVTTKTGFKKMPAFQPRGMKQSRGSSGEGIWITTRQLGSSCTSPDMMVFMGSKDMLVPFAIDESATGFKKSLAFQPHGIKQRRGSSGEGIWLSKTATCTLPDVEALMGTKDTLFKVAMLNISLEDMLAHFTATADLGLEDRLAHFTMEKSAAGVKMMSPAARHQAEQMLERFIMLYI